MKANQFIWCASLGCAALGAALAAVCRVKGLNMKECVANYAHATSTKSATRFTVADRIAAIEAKKPQLKDVARQAGGKLRILVFKQECILEAWAPGWTEPRLYPMTQFSGTLGPKLREGDKQIPEGVYGIEYLNPNSRYYLSLKVSYPNTTDKARAKGDGRTNLGGDIMIHGKDVTIGCVPIGDEAIEDIFYLASTIGIKNVSVVIAPYDLRKGRQPELEQSPLPWYGNLLNELEKELKRPLK